MSFAPPYAILSGHAKCFTNVMNVRLHNCGRGEHGGAASSLASPAHFFFAAGRLIFARSAAGPKPNPFAQGALAINFSCGSKK